MITRRVFEKDAWAIETRIKKNRKRKTPWSMPLGFIYGVARLRRATRNGGGGQVAPSLNTPLPPGATSKLSRHQATLLDFTL